MAEEKSPPRELREAKERFLALIEDIRPELHRYCARMTGSRVEGEDVVQEALARAYYALSTMESIPPLRPWLFRIAHNKALDWLRRYETRNVVSLEETGPETIAAIEDEDPVERSEAASLALAYFVRLPPGPRSAVILKDVLDHSIREIATLLEMTEPAVKAALHRGRKAFQSIAPSGDPSARIDVPAELTRYVALFNARDWDGLRLTLAEDVRLDLVGKARLHGKDEVGNYFGNYDRQEDVHLRIAPFEDEVAIFATQPGWPPYVMLLRWESDRLTGIRDFRYVPYILEDY
jgi:RNA polymerase sigma-70 factor (ECF subfamily)